MIYQFISFSFEITNSRMKSSKISSAPYRARVRRLSKSQLLSIHRANNIRFLRVKIEKVRPTSSTSQQLNKSDFQSASDTNLYGISSIPSRSCIKRIDLSDIQSIHTKKSWKPHTALLKEIPLIQLTNPGSIEVNLFISIKSA
jgi:hypothetical protein